jgi:NTP pyrophosphatase (non-canonical NTP hydrolase)
MEKRNNEIMAIAQEECAEVIQAISKIFRFGFDSSHNGVTNREHLEFELGDLQCMIDLMTETGLADHQKILEAAEVKREKLKIWSNIFK